MEGIKWTVLSTGSITDNNMGDLERQTGLPKLKADKKDGWGWKKRTYKEAVYQVEGE